jgi:uncharacterized protein YciI
MTRVRVVMAAMLLAVLSLLVPRDAAAQDIPMPTEWSTHYAWFLVANPAYVSQGEEAEAALTNAHIQYQLHLHAQGHAIVAGGFAPLPGDPVIGLTVLRAATPEEAQALADADPAVRAGRLLARVRVWWVPTEQLP